MRALNVAATSVRVSKFAATSVRASKFAATSVHATELGAVTSFKIEHDDSLKYLKLPEQNYLFVAQDNSKQMDNIAAMEKQMEWIETMESMNEHLESMEKHIKVIKEHILRSSKCWCSLWIIMHKKMRTIVDTPVLRIEHIYWWHK